MPLDSSAFPEEVQVAFFVFNLLSDVWEGMSGMYMGKDWSFFQTIIDTYQLEQKQQVLFFGKMYERLLVEYRAKEHERKRKAQEAKAGGGKNFTHNVRG